MPWWHPTVSYSVVPFSSCLQSSPASRAFPVRRFFALGGQSIGTSASTSVLPVNIQGWFPLDWLVLSPCCPRFLRIFSGTTIQKHQFFINGRVMAIMVTPSKRTYTSMPHLPGLLLSVSLTPWQASVNPCFHQRLPNTHRQVWLSLLGGHWSFLLGPDSRRPRKFRSAFNGEDNR